MVWRVVVRVGVRFGAALVAIAPSLMVIMSWPEAAAVEEAAGVAAGVADVVLAASVDAGVVAVVAVASVEAGVVVEAAAGAAVDPPCV